MRRISSLFAVCGVVAVLNAAGPKWSREWKVYVITHTHADIGYTDLIPEVERVWCQHWADVSNADYGVAVATREVPAIEFGEIRTNGAFWQGSESWRLGFLELHFAVTSHPKGWREGNVTQFGWEHNAPLTGRYVGGTQAGTLPETMAGFCDGLPKHVILQSLKQAEDGRGYVARFYETEGRGTEVAWSGLPLKIRQASIADLVERSSGAARVEGNTVRFSIGPWQLVTLRLLP